MVKTERPKQGGCGPRGAWSECRAFETAG